MTARIVTATEFPLGSGAYLDFANPDASLLSIEDVAFGVAAASRFAGQTVSRFSGRRVRYTVAEHCVRGSWVAPECLKYPFLMHEIGEAPCGDMVAPLKTLCEDYRRIEKWIGTLGLDWFAVERVDPVALKHIDRRMLATERRDLVRVRPEDVWHWTQGAEAYPDFEIVKPWSFDEAAHEFLKRFAELAPPEIAEREGVFVL